MMSKLPPDSFHAHKPRSITRVDSGPMLTHSPGCAFTCPISLCGFHSLSKSSSLRISETALAIAARVTPSPALAEV